MASASGIGHESREDIERGSSSGKSSTSSERSKGILGVRDSFTASGAEGRSRREDDEEGLKWAAWEKLPSYDRLRTTVLGRNKSSGEKVYDHVDVRTAAPSLNKAFLDKHFRRGPEIDNEDFLLKLRKRLDK